MIKNISFTFSTYYPLFLSPNYEMLSYSTAYINDLRKLKITEPNTYQVSHEALPQFLMNQIKDDKTHFVKTKEFLFVGRSNTGKSSLINNIFHDKKIARAAKRSGTTKFLHFHRLHHFPGLVVDAPGYGYARMNKRRRETWFGLVQEYMKISSRLSQIFLILNIEHGLKQNDKQVLARMSKYNVDIQLVLNKVDKVKEDKFMNQVKGINEAVRRLELPNINNRIIACSNKSKFGIEVLQCRLLEAIQHSKTRNIDHNEDILLEYLKENRVAPTDLKEQQPQLTKQHIVRKLIYNSKLTKYLL